jgi:hypothetical protein
MNDPAFNLAMAQVHPNWYDHLFQVEAAMAEDDRIVHIREAAGWTADEGGWYSPDGVSASDWEDEGLPFPEDGDYAAWASAYWHYEALDNDIPIPFDPCNPSKNASTCPVPPTASVSASPAKSSTA